MNGGAIWHNKMQVPVFRQNLAAEACTNDLQQRGYSIRNRSADTAASHPDLPVLRARQTESAEDQ